MNTYPVCAIIPPLGQASSTWANFPAASSVPVGTLRTATDYNYTEWHSDGTYWKPRGGRQRIYNTIVAFSTTGGTAEVAAYTPTIPAAMLFPGCCIEIGTMNTKTGTAGSTIQRVRYNGGAGTVIGLGATSSASNVGMIGLVKISSGSVSGGNIVLSQPLPTTQWPGIGAGINTPATVTHAIANAVTLNITIQPGSAADTIKLDHCYIEVCG